MSAVIAANTVTVTIDGMAYVGLLQRYNNQLGASPARASVLLVEKTPGTVANSAIRGKTATVTVDATTILTGYALDPTKQLSNQSVTVSLVDKRYLINATYIGANHLDTLNADGTPLAYNGLKYLGADITFNLGGKPNKKKGTGVFEIVPSTPQWMYTAAESDCATEDADFWTYGDILDWIFDNYVTAVAKPTIAAYGQLNRPADEVSLFGVPVAEAIDQVLGRTLTSWLLKLDGTAKLVSLDNPVTTKSITVPSLTSEIANSVFDGTTHVVEFQATDSTEESVTRYDVVGARQIREMATEPADYDSEVDNSIQPHTGWVRGLPSYWSNTSVAFHSDNPSVLEEYTKKHTFKVDRYEAHKAGQNIRDKDDAKPSTLSLTIKRNKQGDYVDAESECGLSPVSVMECLSGQYPLGKSFNADDLEVVATGEEIVLVPGAYNYIQPPLNSLIAPLHLALPVETEVRTYQSATGSTSGFATAVRRMLLREEFKNVTREAVTITAPVLVQLTATGWQVVTEFFTLPTGATRNYPAIGSGEQPFPMIAENFTITLPAGTVIDAMSRLDEVKTLVTGEVSKRTVTVTGRFATWVNVEVGSKLSVTSVDDYGLTGDETITAISWNGQTQELEFQAVNRIGGGVAALARAFVDGRRYRRGSL